MMPPGLDALRHIVVVMMENRSFDHMLGALKAQNPAIDGLTGNESNPDTNGNAVKVQPLAEFQSQLDPDPDHHFPLSTCRYLAGTRARDEWRTCRGSSRAISSSSAI